MAGQVKPIPVPVILAAVNGDENALAAVVAHYQKYIRALATRPVKDEYERLSRDDNLEGESYSIGNQKKLLTKVAKEKGYTNLVHFLDDGISGVTMDRPGFNDMMEQLAAGKAAAVFVKDLSRLGRNYIEVGRLTEEFFPEHDIRLVAVSDNIDTAEGENELAPIRNLFNDNLE